MAKMKNIETGEVKEISNAELRKAMLEGKVTVQQQVQHADGTVTSSAVYGNDTSNGIDHTLNLFGEVKDILLAAMIKAKKIKAADENAKDLFVIDDSDIDYEVVVDDTKLPIMHVVTCTKEGVTIGRYIRDENRSVNSTPNALKMAFENGKITVSLEQIKEAKESSLVMLPFAVHEIRNILGERGILEKVKKIDNKGCGVIITASGENDIDAKIVCGRERPDLPCMLFGGLFSQDMDDAVMMRPYVDEAIIDSLREDMTHEEKIEAAEAGDTDLMEELAMYCLDESDEPEKAVYWFKKMAESGISTAMFSLGLHYAKGFGIERSFKDAVYWMQKAAESGDDDGTAIAEKLSEAIDAEKDAEKGDPKAQAKLAEVYMFLGNSLEQAGPDADYEIAFEYANKSASQDDGDGIWALALCYEHGRGVDENVDKAIELYKKGAELGHAPSQHSLACYLMRGDYLDEDYDTAFKLCEKSAVQGYKLAEVSLAKLYEMGMGCEENIEKAIEWGEKAAEGGDANTQYEVAKLFTYTDESGEMIDAERAKYWYAQAAEKGHEMAQFALNGPLFNDDSEEAEGFKAFNDILDYESELYDEGVLPDSPSPEEDFGDFPRVRLKAEQGDEKAIEILSAWDAVDDNDDADYELGDSEDSAKKDELMAAAKEWMASVIAKDNGIIKTLLTNMDKNCLSSDMQKNESIDFEKLCNEGYIFFDIDEIDWESAKDCILVASKEETPGLFGGVTTNYSIEVIYKFETNRLNGYKTRALEIGCNLNEMINDSKTDDGEKLSYLMCQSQSLTSEYGVTTIAFTTDKVYLPNGVINVFADYDKDTAAIIDSLWKDNMLKEALGVPEITAIEAYEKGYIQLCDNFDENYEKGYDSLLSVTWDFSFDTSINIVPVVRNKKRLKPIVSAIKSQHKSIDLPARGTINYEPEFSDENMKLMDDLFIATLMFK